jgi:hypothetical protein
MFLSFGGKFLQLGIFVFQKMKKNTKKSCDFRGENSLFFDLEKLN